MAEQAELSVSPREALRKKAKRLRKEGILPANIFGHHQDSQAVQVDAHEFEKFMRAHAATSIISLRLPDGGAAQTALIRHVQHDPRSGKVIHIDFFRVSMDERLTVKVPLHFIGEAPGVKVEGGVLLHLLDALEIEGLAGDLPEFIEVDVTPLAEIDAILHASDVTLPANFALITDPAEGVVKVGATRAEVAEEAAEAEAAPAAAETENAEGTTTSEA